MIRFEYSTEFEWERRSLIREILPDVQQYAIQMGVDLEIIEPITDSQDTATYTTIFKLLFKTTSYLMVHNFK